jgi:DNA repair protein RadD
VKLYPDQEEIVQAVRTAMTRSKSVLLQSATGSGKTAMATHMIKAAQGKNKRILFSVPRKDLLEQTSDTFSSLGIAHSYVAAGKSFNPFARVYIGMVDTMARRVGKLPTVDLVIADETHFGDGALDSVLKHYAAAGAWRLGLSATPWKLSGKGLKCWYDTMVEGKPIRWLMDNGRLSDYQYFAGRTKPDLSAVKVTAGDYARGELAGYMEAQGSIIGDCVNDYRQRCMGRLHVVRCASIKHSQMTAQAFRDSGIPFMHVDGETPMDERKRIFRAYARRELLGLTFCDLLNFGFDLSQASGMDVCIESGSDQRPSKSLAGQMQFWGRMLRAKPYPAIICDHVNNCIEHGFPDDEREWTLDDRKQGKKSDAERTVATKQCPQCFRVHHPAPVCVQCGHVYEVKSREIEMMEGELKEMTRAERDALKQESIKKRKMENSEAYRKGFDALVVLGRSRGYQYPEQWAAKLWTLRARKR